jgi:nitrate reductase alpha subunit
VKAEDGGMGGQGIWSPATTGYTPANENPAMKKCLAGGFLTSAAAGEDFWS